MSSIYNLITELCSSLCSSIVTENADSPKLMKKMRSYAFEILLTQRNTLKNDIEDDPAMIFVDIMGHIYWKEKAKGGWTEETSETIKELMNKVETLSFVDTSVVPVSKLLLCLADSAAPSPEDPSYGLDMKTLIKQTNLGLKHKSVLKYPAAFNSDIFEFPAYKQQPKAGYSDAQIFSAIPGVGLRHQQFFTIPTLERSSSSITLKNIDEHDLTNANWIFPKLQNNSERCSDDISRMGMHQDEGYITPDQDLKIMMKGELPYIPWEELYKEEFKPVYSWASFGSSTTRKELPFLSRNRDAMDHVWKVVHAFNITSSFVNSKAVPTILKPVTLEDMERAFKNLLIGVESAVFQYNHTKKSFVLREGLYLKGSASKTLEEYCEGFIECANSFCRLSTLLERTSEPTSSDSYGRVYQALCSNIRHYVQCYRGVVLCLPPLHSMLHTYNWLYKLRTHLQFIASLCLTESMPTGGALLAHLYNQVPLVTRIDLSFILYYILQSCCTVYFEFLKRWIFEGLCDDIHNDFFIDSCPLSEMPYNRKFWTRCFVLNKMQVPGFLKGLESDMFVCGKSMALLKLCAPDDPVCLCIKQGYPGVVCCLNKTHLAETEEQCRLYKERCKAYCQEMFGGFTTEPKQEEDHYTVIRAKSIDRIKRVQEEEKKLKSEKKRIEFEILKKNMEDAEARKLEDKKNILEEEERLLEEAEKMDHLNNLRREEERKKLIHHYSAMSDAADKRREKAEWKIKRAELHNKRVEFYKTKQQLESLEIVQIIKDNSLESTEKSENLNCAIAGSGDYIVLPNSKEDDFSETGVDLIDNVVDQSLEIKFSSEQNNINLQFEVESTSKINEHSDYAGILDKEKRDWLIALDVADQAKQSAMKFKERNMFNDYNILTGEVSTFNSRFGSKMKTNGIAKTVEEDLTVPVNQESFSLECNFESTVVTQASNERTKKILSEEIERVDTPTMSDTQASNESSKKILSEEIERVDTPTVSHTISVQTSFHPNTEITHQELSNITRSKSCSIFSNTLEKLGMPYSPKGDLNIDEIDMTTIYQNLQMSVMIPLFTQLELANEAILRLFFNKHNLIKHLECIRKYFFLLEGEFGRNLTRNLFAELQVVEHPVYILNVSRLNSLLRSAVGTSVDEEFTERLSFFVQEIPPVFRLIDPKTLDCLSMRYRTHWPLNVIITNEAIIKCDRVFTFLVQLQRTSWALEQDIYLLKDKRLQDSVHYRQVQLYRHIMTHFVTTLKNYVTAVVLEESWFQFREELRKVKTLNNIYAAHVKYIKMLLFRCLLNKRSRVVNGYLLELFGVILVFHEVLRSGEWMEDPATGDYQHSGFPRLRHQLNSFLQLSKFLYKYLERLVTNGYQPHLVQLLTLLSANNFYNED